MYPNGREALSYIQYRSYRCMSYSGTYGDDETCPCGHYYRSCPIHSLGSTKRFNQHIRALRETAEKETKHLERATFTKKPIIYYRLSCSQCDWTAVVKSEEIQKYWTEHLKHKEENAASLRKQLSASDAQEVPDDGWRPHQVRR